MGTMNQLSLVIKHLRALADSLEDLGNGTVPVASHQDQNLEEVVTPAETLPSVAIEDIRKVLAEKSQAGKTDKVRELLQRYGANKLSEVEVNQYPSLLEDAKGL